MKYRVEITQPAEEMLKELKSHGKKTLVQLRAVILGLQDDPEAQTQPLRGVLSGYRSLHSGRFRVVVRICQRRVVVYVIGVGFHRSGSRDDIYELATKALRLQRPSPADPT